MFLSILPHLEIDSWGIARKYCRIFDLQRQPLKPKKLLLSKRHFVQMERILLRSFELYHRYSSCQYTAVTLFARKRFQVNQDSTNAGAAVGKDENSLKYRKLHTEDEFLIYFSALSGIEN